MTSDETLILEMLSCVVRSLVERPEEVNVISTVDGETLVFRVLTHSRDFGKLIGRGGRTARALRAILSASAMKAKRSYRLDIVEGQPPENEYS